MIQALVDHPDRVPDLEGARNFRDLGGYPTADGRHVRWGLLFRSGVLTGLGPDQVRRLRHDLNMQVICDLRTDPERAGQPSPPGITARDYLGWDYDSDEETLIRVGSAPGATADHMRDALLDAYRSLPWRLEPQYRAAFRHIVAGDLPMIFHCSGGKDRTGILAALILSAVGVQRDIVLADYALTDRLLDTDKALAARRAAGDLKGVAALPIEIRHPIVRTHPMFLDASLEEIDRRCGSVTGFLDQVLGVGPEDLETIKTRLLEP